MAMYIGGCVWGGYYGYYFIKDKVKEKAKHDNYKGSSNNNNKLYKNV